MSAVYFVVGFLCWTFALHAAVHAHVWYCLVLLALGGTLWNSGQILELGRRRV